MQSRWVLQVKRTGSDEVRRLFDNGKEVKRWEITWNREKTEKVERETAGGPAVTRRVYDASGSLLQEEEYAAGKLSRKTLFTYVNGRLLRTRTLAGEDGAEVSSEVYLYAVNGALREVRRSAAPGESTVTSAVTSGAGLVRRESLHGRVAFHRALRYRGTDGQPRAARRWRVRFHGGLFLRRRLPHALLPRWRSCRQTHALVDPSYDEEGRLSLQRPGA